MVKITPVVMAGGRGTRLWPLSTTSEPKQYQALISDRTMLEETLARVKSAMFNEAMVIGGRQHRSIIEAQSPSGTIVLEPFGRNTAPAAITAALLLADQDPDALLLLLPADHHIADVAAFHQAISSGVTAAEQGYLVTLGITPDRPETGYGYIKRGDALGEGVFGVDAFVEKPSRKIAETYVASGDYAWNAGIFLFRASRLLAEAQTLVPLMLAQTQAALRSAHREGRVTTFTDESFGAIEGDSLDYAIMERSERVAVVSPIVMGWSDIGSWAAVKDFAEHLVSPDAVAVDCEGTLIKTVPGGPLVGAVGLEGFVVVATKKSVLIIPEDRAQDVKLIIEELERQNRDDQL